jgi:uncharacterized protein YbjT (DUF2867 family)
MYQSKLLVVLGATGTQGGAVLRYFAQQRQQNQYGHGFRLRGVTRNPDSQASQALQEFGVEMVKADLEDIDSIKRAFSGATHLFAITAVMLLSSLSFNTPKNLRNLGKAKQPRRMPRLSKNDKGGML